MYVHLLQISVNEHSIKQIYSLYIALLNALLTIQKVRQLTVSINLLPTLLPLITVVVPAK